MKLLVLVLSLITLAFGAAFAPCLDAQEEFALAPIQVKTAVDALNAEFNDLANLDVSDFNNIVAVANVLQGLFDGSLQWMGIAFGEDLFLGMYGCDGTTRAGSDLCAQVGVNGTGDFYFNVAAALTNNTFSSYNSNYEPLVRTEELQYVATQRPWYGLSGWISYDFIGDTGDVTGQGFTWVWTSGDLTIGADYNEDIDPACDADISNRPCTGALYSDARQQVIDLGALGVSENVVQSAGDIQDIVNFGNQMFDETDGAKYWVAFAWGDDMVAIRECDVPENLDDARCIASGGEDVISIVSFDWFGNYSQFTYDVDGVLVLVSENEFKASTRPWYNSADAWVSYTFATGPDGYSYTRDCLVGDCVIAADWAPSERDCTPSFEGAPCAGVARGADAVLNAMAAEKLGAPSWATEAGLISWAKDLIDEVAGNALWVGYAQENNIVTIEDCTVGTNAAAGFVPCDGAADDFVISISSLVLYGDIRLRSFNLDGSSITRPDVNYTPILRPWYKENGWVEYTFSTSGELGHSFAISVDNGAVLGDYSPVDGECEVVLDLDQAPCEAAIDGSVSVAGAEALSELQEVLDGFIWLDEALALGNAMIEVTEASWAVAAYGDEAVVVINCDYYDGGNQICEAAADAPNPSTRVISIVSNDIFGDRNWRSYTPAGDELERDLVEYFPTLRPWFRANGWATYEFVSQSGVVTGNGYTFVIPVDNNQALVAVDYYEQEGICATETTSSSSAIIASLTLAALALF